MNRGNLIAIVLCVVAPLIFSFLFLTMLTPINWTQMTGGFPQILAILSFSTIGFAYTVPIFGWGYGIPLVIWILTGILVGLASKGVKKAVGLTLLGLLIQVLLFTLLTTIDASFIPAFLQNSQNALLLSGFSLEFIVALGLFLFWYALTVPGAMLGGIMGGLISRSGIPLATCKQFSNLPVLILERATATPFNTLALRVKSGMISVTFSAAWSSLSLAKIMDTSSIASSRISRS